MGNQSFHLAQLNVARLKAPLDDPTMHGFVSQLESIYAVAESAEGFVWRLKPDDGSAFGMRAGSDSRLVVTMSVWESLEALHAYVYLSAHKEPLRNRAEWFEKADGPSVVLWWIPRDTLPRVEQGMARLKYLARRGPTAFAFTFKDSFPPPAERE
ncbi:MAG TPA: DUF3291 domain-containing protein [Pyrinomonadaceae bacterium]